MISIALIHPMLVHFPIVLFLASFAADCWILARGADLSGREYLPEMALAFLILGVLSACLAAVFGDIAMDKAVSAGFPAAPIERHETFAMTALGLFAFQALQRNADISGDRAVGAQEAIFVLRKIATIG